MKTYTPRSRTGQSSHWFGIQMMDMVYTMAVVAVILSRLPQNLRGIAFLIMPAGIFFFSRIRSKTRELFLVDYCAYHLLPKRVSYENSKSY